jgi:hypothetical protein
MNKHPLSVDSTNPIVVPQRCFICFEESTIQNPLLHPCQKCADGYHLDCVKDKDHLRLTHCGQCKTPFAIEYEYPTRYYFWSFVKWIIDNKKLIFLLIGLVFVFIYTAFFICYWSTPIGNTGMALFIVSCVLSNVIAFIIFLVIGGSTNYSTWKRGIVITCIVLCKGSTFGICIFGLVKRIDNENIISLLCLELIISSIPLVVVVITTIVMSIIYIVTCLGHVHEWAQKTVQRHDQEKEREQERIKSKSSFYHSFGSTETI